jgi:hypothetical protein
MGAQGVSIESIKAIDEVSRKIPVRETFEGNEEMWDSLHEFLDSGNLEDAQVMLQVMAAEYPEYEDELYDRYYELDAIIDEVKYGD